MLTTIIVLVGGYVFLWNEDRVARARHADALKRIKHCEAQARYLSKK